MGKYTSSSRMRLPPKPNGPHVIWRGIGCLMMLIIPAVSIAAGIATVDYGLKHNWPIPYQLLTAPSLPNFFYKSSGLLTIFGPLTQIPTFYAYVAVSLLYMMLIGGVISLIYAYIFRFIGPSRYGPLDAPPPKIKTKRYTR
jgi:hypothetical protein